MRLLTFFAAVIALAILAAFALAAPPGDKPTEIHVTLSGATGDNGWAPIFNGAKTLTWDNDSEFWYWTQDGSLLSVADDGGGGWAWTASDSSYSGFDTGAMSWGAGNTAVTFSAGFSNFYSLIDGGGGTTNAPEVTSFTVGPFLLLLQFWKRPARSSCQPQLCCSDSFASGG